MGSPIFSINLTIENDSIPAIKSKLSYVHMSIKKSQAILQSFTTLRAEVSLLHGQSFQLLICRVVGLFFIRLRFNTIRSAQREIIIQNIFSFSENKKHLFTCKAATGIGEKVTYIKLVDYAQRKEQVICGHCDMQICHSDVDTFRKSVGSTRTRPISKRQLSQIVLLPRCADFQRSQRTIVFMWTWNVSNQNYGQL